MLLQGLVEPPRGCEGGISSKSPWGNHIDCLVALTGHVSHEAALKVEQVPPIADTPLPVIELKGPSGGCLFSKDGTTQPA